MVLPGLPPELAGEPAADAGLSALPAPFSQETRTMSHILGAALLVAILFGLVLVCLEAGWRAGRRRARLESHNAFAGQGTVEAAVFGLMALLMAFTFSGAASRFDSKRQLVIQEANAIGTAYLRLDLLPPAAQAFAGPLQAVPRRPPRLLSRHPRFRSIGRARGQLAGAARGDLDGRGDSDS